MQQNSECRNRRRFSTVAPAVPTRSPKFLMLSTDGFCGRSSRSRRCLFSDSSSADPEPVGSMLSRDKTPVGSDRSMNETLGRLNSCYRPRPAGNRTDGYPRWGCFLLNRNKVALTRQCGHVNRRHALHPRLVLGSRPAGYFRYGGRNPHSDRLHLCLY
jgi:hypothetical protein